jgi:hypothetical protein
MGDAKAKTQKAGKVLMTVSFMLMDRISD